MRAAPAVYKNPIVRRIIAHALENQISLSELSRRAGLSRSTAQKVCTTLESGSGDVGLATLTALAQAMGYTLTWLLYGDSPPSGIRLRDLPGWENAAREAVDRLGADAETVKAVGGWILHEMPPRMDAFLVAGLARTFGPP